MADMVAGVASVGSQTLQFQNAPAATGSGPEAGLSDAARGILASISDLQAGFQKDVVPTAGARGETAATGVHGAEAPKGDAAIEDAASMLAAQIEQSTAVQQQLAHFVMASSVSSSLGRNLNMFLRGQ